MINIKGSFDRRLKKSPKKDLEGRFLEEILNIVMILDF
jgi:hypothetical protein